MTAIQNLGLGSWPRRRALLSPERPAIYFEGTTYNYAEFDQRVRDLAGALAAAGVGPYDRVAYWGANHVRLIETLFATARLGAIAVLLNSRLAAGEAGFVFGDSTPKVVLIGSAQRAGMAVLEAEGGRLPLVFDVDAADGEATHPDIADAPGYGSETSEVPCGWDDAALIMYTSGTTGRAKGAVLTHGNIFFHDVNALIETDIRPDEICLAAAPLFHIAGLNGLALPTILKGGLVVITRSVVPSEIFELIEKFGITSMFAVPTTLDGLAHEEAFATADLSTMRTIIAGGAPVPERLLRLWSDRDIAVQQGYGLTETAPAVLKLAAEDGIRKAGAAGKPQFLVDVRLVGNDGRPVAQGEIGEILTVGPNVFREYWNLPEASVAAFKDGWFRTGDGAVQDEDGYYFIRDRFKDMYISGGENVYPAQVESALLDVPGVADAAVFGVPDEQWGETGVAYLTRNDEALTAEDVVESLRTRVARYKVPKQIVFVDELPRTASGKLQKNVLREQHDAQLASAQLASAQLTNAEGASA